VARCSSRPRRPGRTSCARPRERGAHAPSAGYECKDGTRIGPGGRERKGVRGRGVARRREGRRRGGAGKGKTLLSEAQEELLRLMDSHCRYFFSRFRSTFQKRPDRALAHFSKCAAAVAAVAAIAVRYRARAPRAPTSRANGFELKRGSARTRYGTYVRK
jgi:hypothetical protein